MIRSAYTAFGTIGALMCATTASASVLFTPLDTDQDVNALELDEVLTAEGRIGTNGANGGDFEFDLGPSTAAPAQTAQYTWNTNQLVDFSLNYNPITGDTLFSTPAGDLEYTVPGGGPLVALAIRVRATTQRPGISVVLSDILVDGAAYGTTLTASNPGDGVNNLLIEGSELADGFTLSGKALMVFDPSNPPQRSNLAFQIKGFVPTPGAAGLLAIGALAAGRRRR